MTAKHLVKLARTARRYGMGAARFAWLANEPSQKFTTKNARRLLQAVSSEEDDQDYLQRYHAFVIKCKVQLEKDCRAMEAAQALIAGLRREKDELQAEVTRLSAHVVTIYGQVYPATEALASAYSQKTSEWIRERNRLQEELDR